VVLLVRCLQELGRLASDVKSAVDAFSATVAFYGEDVAATTTESLFGLVDGFTKTLQVGSEARGLNSSVQ
jgi:hypothetical protein